MRYVTLALAVVALLSASEIIAQDDTAGPPAIGDPAPALNIEVLLQAPEDADASWAVLRGQVVVLEFWATWCGPCIAAVPHLNELAEHFSDEDVIFISVTDEKEEVVAPFLQKKRMKTWVGLDLDRSLVDAFRVRGIPHTVIIDRDGRIAAMTHPMRLEAPHLRRVLNGEPSGLTAPMRAREETVPATRDNDVEPLFEVSITRSEQEGSSMISGPGRLFVTGQPLKNLIGIAWNTSPQRIDVRATLPDDDFSVRVITPDTERVMLERAMREAIERAFSLRASPQPREVETLVLSFAGDPGPELQQSATDEGWYTSSGAGFIALAGASMATLTEMIESVLGQSVVDETALDGRWDARLRWDAKDDADLARALREDLGLELSNETREIEFLIIEEAIPEQNWRKYDRVNPVQPLPPPVQGALMSGENEGTGISAVCRPADAFDDYSL